MIRLVKTLHRAFKRRRHFQSGKHRLAALAPDIAKVVGGKLRFRQGVGGGHDFVYFVESDGARVGVLRIANPEWMPASLPEAARLNGPRMRLPPTARVEREWRVCEAGWQHALTPKPLWRAPDNDALLVSYIPGDRLFNCVQQKRIAMWDAIDRTAERVGTFHSVIGEAHTDLSLFNVYADDRLDVLTFIDFELAPAPMLSAAEARLFDYLNLVEMAYKEMSAEDKGLAPHRLQRLFAELVPDDVKGLSVSKLSAKLPRILADPTFREILARHLAL